jgi:hypothetical protein
MTDVTVTVEVTVRVPKKTHPSNRTRSAIGYLADRLTGKRIKSYRFVHDIDGKEALVETGLVDDNNSSKNGHSIPKETEPVNAGQ